jgi:hypothetical protein
MIFFFFLLENLRT